MLPTTISAVLQDREEAGYQLSEILAAYRNSNAIVVGIPPGGVCVASAIAETLSLPLEIMPCRKIKDPANGKKDIGSVSEDDVFIHDCCHTIPQDYIYHQIAMLRNVISDEKKKYYGSGRRQPLRHRPVILVDDILSSSDTMMPCLRSIKKQRPLKVVVAVPVVAAEAARTLGTEADEIRCLRIEASLEPAHEYFVDFPNVDDNRVKALFEASRKALEIYEQHRITIAETQQYLERC